jgi:hypothetical protein
MSPTSTDPCFLSTKGAALAGEQTPRGIICLQTDDTIGIGNSDFLEKEARMSTTFDSKPRQIVAAQGDKQDYKKQTVQYQVNKQERKNVDQFTSSITFNGTRVELISDGIYRMTQADQINKIQEIETKNLTSPQFVVERFVAERARAAYVASMCRPDIAFCIAAASQVTEPTLADVTALNAVLRKLKETAEKGLDFVPLNLERLHLAVFVDASFANNRDLTSQLGFVITLADGDHDNIVHWGSVKSRRVTRSALAAELYAMAHGFDVAAAMKESLTYTFDRQLPLKTYTDSRSLFDALVTLNNTAEKRLLIDLQLLRQAYERREITEVCWIPTEQNPADAMTKGRPTPALDKLLMRNRVELNPTAWVDR